MSKVQDDRRSGGGANEGGRESMSDVVRKALLIQRRDGTVSAIEYMKLGRVPSAVIERIASGSAIRSDDTAMLATDSGSIPV